MHSNGAETMQITAKDYRMTRATAERVILDTNEAERGSIVFRKATITTRAGRRLERYCLIFDGHVIRSAQEWRRFRSPAGFTSALVSKLHEVTA